MKTGYILAAITAMALLSSCQSPSADSIRSEIAKLKNESFQIDKKVAALEKQLALVDRSTGNAGLIPVSVKTIAPEGFNHYIELSATVEADEDAMVSPETSGQIKKVLVSKGQLVKKGTPLVRLSTEIMDNSIMEVKNQLSLAQDVYEKQKALWEQKVGSEIQYLQAKNNKEMLERRLETLRSQLNLSTLNAAFSGIVDDIYQKEGELAIPGKAVLHLVNPSSIKIKADASERYVDKIRRGQKVDISFPSSSTYKLTLPISRVGSVVDLQTRTFPVEVAYNGNNGKVLPNQMASIMLKDFSADNAMVVPSIIIKNDEKGQFLFIAEKTPKGYTAKKVYVTAGISYRDDTKIDSGLKPGDKVIVAGYNQVTTGSPIAIK